MGPKSSDLPGCYCTPWSNPRHYLLSGDYSRVNAFQKQLQPSYSRHEDVAPHGSTVPTCGDGNSIVVLGKVIPFPATVRNGVNFFK